MAFSGTLSTMHLAEIRQRCKNGRKTGTLTLERGEIRKDVYFESGRIIPAGSNDPREHLGRHPISRGTISEEQSAEAFVLSRTNGRWSVGSIVAICPFGELQALRILQRLLGEKTIALEPRGSGGEGR